MRNASAILSCVVLATPALAQVRENWIQPYDGIGGQDDLTAMDFDGTRVAVAGPSFNPGATPRSDIETCVYDLAGNVVWSARWTGAGNHDDLPRSVRIDAVGGVYVAGRTRLSITPSLYRRVLLRYDAAGNLQWSRISGVAHEFASSSHIEFFANGDLAVTGTEGTNGGDLLVERWDPSGHNAWSWSADGGMLGHDGLSGVAIGSTGEVLASGWVGQDPAMTNVRDIPVVRLDGATGAHAWTTIVGGGAGGSAFGGSVLVDAAGTVYVGGYVDAPGNGNDAFVGAFDSAGLLQWSHAYDGGFNGHDRVIQLAFDPFGRLYAGGYARATTPTRDMAIWRFDLAGTLEWSAVYDGPFQGEDVANGLTVDRFGNATLGGWVLDASTFDTDFALVGWDSSGALRWTYTDDGPGNSSQFVTRVVAVGDRIAAGGTSFAGGGDFHTALLTRFAVPFCLGDGSATPCPCANASVPADVAGCRNSLGSGGRLDGTGNASLAADTFVLDGRDMPNSSALYFQGTSLQNGGQGSVFGDGLRCASGMVIRLGTQTNVAGASTYPEPGDAAISVRGAIGAPGTYTYQAWYRNAASFCTPSTFNLSNALAVAWSV